jgi:hypothetical protein
MDGLVEKHGIIAPEILAGYKNLFPRIISSLEAHGIDVSVEKMY